MDLSLLELPEIWTPGAMLFFGGLAGAALTLIASVLTALVLKKSRRSIAKKLNAEYGGQIK